MRNPEYYKMVGAIKELTRQINFIIEKSIIEEDRKSNGDNYILILVISMVNIIKDYYGAGEVTLSKKGKEKMKEALEDIEKGKIERV